jgi:CRP-like cAMP-binding protein
MGDSTSHFDLFRDDPDARRFEIGAVIFKIGERGSDMYVVSSGTVALRAGADLLETVEAGGFFGEMALVDDEPRSATAVAVTECRLSVIDRKRFEETLRRVPSFGTEVMRVMARRLRARTAAWIASSAPSD